MPAYFLLHYRLLGCVQRSDNRKLVVKLAPFKLVPAGGKPPPEATDEICQSGLLDCVAKNSTLLADGCRSWSAAAQQRSHEGRCLRVSHSKNEFSRRAANCNRVLGTQLLDRSWGNLKSCVPKQAASKKLRCDGFEPQVLDYVWQSLWRKATGTSKLLSELGRLAKAA